MQIRRNPESALADHAVSVAEAPVTRAAKDIESVAPALQQSRSQRQRNRLEKFSILGASVNGVIIVEFIACDGACRNRPGIPSVREEIVLSQRFVFGLILHVSTAAPGEEDRQRQHGLFKSAQLPRLQSAEGSTKTRR